MDINPLTHIVISKDQYDTLLIATNLDARRFHGAVAAAKFFDVNLRTLQNLAAKNPDIVRKDATGKYNATMANWKKLLWL